MALYSSFCCTLSLALCRRHGRAREPNVRSLFIIQLAFTQREEQGKKSTNEREIERERVNIKTSCTQHAHSLSDQLSAVCGLWNSYWFNDVYESAAQLVILKFDLETLQATALHRQHIASVKTKRLDNLTIISTHRRTISIVWCGVV